MGFRKHDNSGNFPSWTATLGSMAAAFAEKAGWVVTAQCDTCQGHKRVDLQAMIKSRGPDYSLVNRRVRCHFQPGCPGRVRFFYYHGIMYPLNDSKTAERWSDIDWDARMSGVERSPAASRRIRK